MKQPAVFHASLALVLLISGCANAPERELTTEVPPYVMLPNGDKPLHPGTPSRVTLDTTAAFIENLRRNKGESINILQLSGGGQNGAFGAGILNGWTKAGTRPEFDIVSGVSTGNLIATFAFLGTPDDDRLLKEMWLSIERKDIYIKGGVARILVGKNSLYNTKPLKKLIAGIITPEVLQRVAVEYDKGRRLFVSTVNLDYNQTWVWDLTAIAKHAGADALELYRKVVLASASPPILFPPVEINGFLFIDGGTRHNLLIVGLNKSRDTIVKAVGGNFKDEDFKGRVFVILHHKSNYEYGAVKADLKDLLSRTANIAVQSTTSDSILRSYFVARFQGLDFNITHIPNDLDIGDNSLSFDTEMIRRMYDAGESIAKNGMPWAHSPETTGEIGPWLMEEVVKRIENRPAD